MTIARLYTNAVHRNLGPLFANWEPATPIDLGDYGERDGPLFKRLGNIAKAFGVSFAVERPAKRTHHSFVSSKSVTVTLTAAGEAGPAGQATLEIGFGSNNGVYLDAAGCRHERIADKRELGEKLERIGNFERRWAVVTDRLVAARSIIAISNGKDGRVVLRADAQVPTIDLANANIGLSVAGRQNIGYLVEAENGLTPLMGLCGFRRRFLRGDEFEVFGRGSRSKRVSGSDVDAADPNDLVFEQLR
jgi:hypothetical protein